VEAGAALPKSILETRASEVADRRARMTTYAQEHALTQQVLKDFSGKIIDIRVTDSSP
jgi:negative regulator of genetic competence, sporulation and motility